MITPNLFRPFRPCSDLKLAGRNTFKALQGITLSHAVPTVPTYLYIHIHTPVRVARLHVRNNHKYVGTVGTNKETSKKIKDLRCSDLMKTGRNRSEQVGTTQFNRVMNEI
jgi:hypothetical protein